MMPMILTVYLSKGEQAVAEVPVTPETTCRDVVDVCRAPGEGSCHLAEVWRGNERAIPSEHLMYEHLQKWGARRSEVKFFLRHVDSPAETGSQGNQPSQEQANRRNAGNPDKSCENGEQRLRYLKQQERKQQSQSSQPAAQTESEKLQRLKERVDSQEAKLRKIRAMRGQVDCSKSLNGSLSAEMEHINGMFLEKQQELQSAVLKVEQLTQQLEELRRAKLGGQVPGTAALELRRLYQELQIRSKLNQEQSSRLQQHKDLLNKRNLEVALMDKRISELRERLHRKKAEAPQKGDVPAVIGGPGRVATVGPFIQVPVSEPVKPLPSAANPTVGHARPKAAGDPGWPPLKPPDYKDVAADAALKSRPPPPPPMPPADREASTVGSGPAPGPAHAKPLPPPYGSHCAAARLCTAGSAGSLERPKEPPPRPPWPRPPPPPGSSSQQIQQRISVPPSPVPPPERPEPPPLPPAAAVRPFAPDKAARPQSPRRAPPTVNSSSIYHMYLQQAAPKAGSKPAAKAVYGKPLLPPGSLPSSPLLYTRGVPAPRGPVGGESDAESSPAESLPRPLSPSKLTPVAHSPLRYQSEGELEALRRRLANAPRPLKKRSSITEPEGPGGPNIQKLLYQRFNTLAGGIEGGATFYQPTVPTGLLADADNGNLPDPPGPAPGSGQPPPPPSSDANDNRPPAPSSDDPAGRTSEDSNNNPAGPTDALGTAAESSPLEEAGAGRLAEKRTNLKKPDSQRTGRGLRVQFNPLALLLDASLEGEFDLVQRIIYEVENPSKPNDEGITPLHNAVCAGHHHIVKFLLDFGVNVNAADSDGWTPLHCAASCNSVQLCKLLVESGAAVFATTISDVETAADKCEEMEDGYLQCSQFLYGVQEKLGVMNKGAVYALWDYEAQSADELSFREGDAITILRRKDDSETQWWWARLKDKEGYVPRNLLGLYPRIKPRQRSLA
ncbi:apoptosis-stimulating of p53 protein 1-like isoform X2 [Paramormyrops kingsleyae]|uniref:apoptosis-stimulating of p53 protein 1-like isoform X2 n=1 Tax=Paramormyrops kingsleyae TaxID=1676925 RepID=UPI000CD5D015|nr:apoptosis-stimulating of p53 protein 1-like isoform X1 [Paramormyrops kingsleyae]XP_023668581.1 apoptosis-stimulating of p53 protein 1-like isoform X1 [Paramormyrops kingsleyae]XP_023668582.1 apoptosis-stimulating of p53 protein 1-like isoform X1 [Paramormyrops kingsleyae]